MSQEPSRRLTFRSRVQPSLARRYTGRAAPADARSRDSAGRSRYRAFLPVPWSEGDEKLLFLSDIDGETDEYIERLVESAEPVFDAIFTYVDNPPPTPVAE